MIVVLGYIMGHNPQILKSTSEMYTFLHTPLLLYLWFMCLPHRQAVPEALCS